MGKTKVVNFLFVSLVFAGLAYLAFAFMLGQNNPLLWDKVDAGLFIIVTIFIDIFLIRIIDNNGKSNRTA